MRDSIIVVDARANTGTGPMGFPNGENVWLVYPDGPPEHEFWFWWPGRRYWHIQLNRHVQRMDP